MLGMGPMEIAVIVVVALIIFGPGKLPEIGQTIGRAVRDFRSATQDITGDFQRTMNEFQETADDFKNTALELQHEAESTFSGVQDDITSAARDFEKTTVDASRQATDGLELDQLDSPATRPAVKAEADSAVAKKTSPAAKSKTSTKPKAKSAASSTNKTEKSASKTAKPKKAKATSAKAGADEKGNAKKSREAPAKKTTRRRTPATVSASSSPSKDDPLADLMGVDDGPIISSRSRSNGRS